MYLNPLKGTTMSLEQAITDHASAIRELAAAILKVAAPTVSIVSTKTDTTVEKAVEAKKEVEKKAPPAEKPKDATSKPGADPKANAAASSIDYASIRGKVLDLTKQPEGRDRCGALLARFGVTKGPDLKPEQLEEFNDLLDKTLAGEIDPRSMIEDPAGDADDGMA